MGVHGLWRLIEPAGKPVPLETLENKILAVDISIWLHQAIKGFQDSRGAPLPNAHLLGIYHRICKLLYFKIKPVFVFDGGVPVLKKQTMAKRQQLKSRNQSEADKIQKQLISALLKHSAISNVLSEKTKASISSTKVSPEKSKIEDDLFALPSTSMDSTLSSSEDEGPIQYTESSDDEAIPSSQVNIHNIDTESKDFKSLPADVRYEILSEVKETRKQSSWGRIHELPTKSDDFSVYQMGRLLQRQSVQSEIEKIEREMGGHSLSLGELESLMRDQGIITKNDTVGKRIASDENTKFLLIKDVKQAIEEAQKACKEETTKEELDIVNEILDKEKLKNNLKKKSATKEESKPECSAKSHKTIADLEYEDDLEKAIKLSLECVSENSENNTKQIEDKTEDVLNVTVDCSFINEESDSCDEEIASEMISKMTSAQSYMLEYSGLTPNEIAKILKQNCNKKKSDKKVVKIVNKKHINKENTNKESELQKSIEMSTETKDKEIISKKNESSDVDKNEETILKTQSAIEIVVDNDKDIVTEKSEKPGNKSENKTSEATVGLKNHNINIQIIDDKNNTNQKESNHVEIMSDSDSSVAADVNDESKPDSFEIIVNPNEAVEDDLFKDIFEDNNEEKEICKSKDLGSNVGDKNLSSINNEEVEYMSDSSESDDNFVDVPEEVTPKISETAIEHLEISEKSTSQSKNDDEISEQSNKSQETNTATEIAISDSKNIDSASNSKCGDRIDKIVSTSESVTKRIADIELELAKMHSEEDTNVNETVSENLSHAKENVDEIISENLPQAKEDVSDDKLKENEKSSDKIVAEDTIKAFSSEIKEAQYSVEQLQEMKEDLRKEQFKLQTEKSLKERLAGNITDQMYQEAQELLELFGVPYIIAPMEAEAQCAFLDEINLTDGTITDDSDIWLFGGKTVYKNFFNQSKHVMEFRAENILHYFKLTREQMILLALLVGSDYTTGIQGVGPVTALEILAAFPPASTTEFSLTQSQLLSGLAEFRNWFNKGKGPGFSRTALRSKLKNVKFSENFPSVQVVEAYLQPKVETSREKFSWSKPDIVGLIDFARQKFGWTITKSEEILNPVIKRLEEKHSQKTIRDYFRTESKIISGAPNDKMSKRVKTAIKRIGNEPVDEDEPKQKLKRPRKKKKEDAQETKPVSNDQTENTLEMELERMFGDFVTPAENKTIKNSSVKSNKKSEDEIREQKPKRRGRKKKNADETENLTLDEDIRILQATASHSSQRVQEINSEIENEIKKTEIKKAKAPNLHKKEVIPQRERDKAELMRKKLKAIEVFRKSQKGPGYVAKRVTRSRALKEDAGLSESSSDEN